MTPPGAGKQRFDCLIDGRQPRDHGMHGLRDRHVDATRGRHLYHRACGIDALGDGQALLQQVLEASPLPELDSERHVARLRAAAGQQEIAEAREPGQCLAPRTEA